jgi:hypothetical protein
LVVKSECYNITKKHKNTSEIKRSDVFLLYLTAKYSGRRVVTGVTEATAIGNLAVQLIAGGEIADTRAARRLIADSFPLVEIK